MGSPLFSTCFWVLTQLLSHLPPGGSQTVPCGDHSCSITSCCLKYSSTQARVCGCPPGMVPTPYNSSIICQSSTLQPPCNIPSLVEEKEKCRDPQASSGDASCTQTIQRFLQKACNSPPTNTLQTLLPQLQEKADTSQDVKILLKSTEDLVLQVALGGFGSQNFNTTTMEAKAEVVEDNCSRKLALDVGGQTLTINCYDVVTNSKGDKKAVVFIVYKDIKNLLTNVTKEEEEEEIISPVVGSTVSNLNNSFTGVFNITLQHHKAPQAGREVLCAFWDAGDTQGQWKYNGCRRTAGNDTFSICTCDHFTTFAILMALKPPGDDDGVLSVVTYVGISVSLVCLFLTILTFLLCRSLWSVSVALHLQLSICLFAANLLFLVAGSQTKNMLACGITAGFLHYTLLSSFSWMFLEGLHLFLTVRNLRVLNYTSASRFRKRFIYPVGYGVPAIVVAISAAIHPQGYGTEHFCWLSTERGFIWSFLGPICAIILVNLLFFLITLWTLRHRLSSLNADVTAIKNTRMMTFKALMHICILGCTWGVGFLKTQGDNVVVNYIFTIINTLQGAFIFLVHCVLNRQVTEQYRRWFRALRRQAHPQEMPTTEINITYTTEGERYQTQTTEGCTWEK